MFSKLLLQIGSGDFSYRQAFYDIKSAIKEALNNAYIHLVTLGRVMLYRTLHWLLIKILL
jgi:hypothetical protein